MEKATRKAIDVQEVRYEDGRTGLVVGGVLHMGYSEEDALKMLDGAIEDGTDTFMTTEEIMRAFSVSQRTVYRWKSAGRLSWRKAGRRLLFNREEVAGLLDSSESMSASCE